MTVTAVTLTGALFAVPAPPAGAGHGGFPQSNGIYRIPYDDGTQLAVTRDHHNHGGGPGLNNSGNNRIDMVASAPPATVVAAAFGTVMAIVDIHGNSNGNGDGLDIDGNSGQILLDGQTVHSDALEHSCQDTNEDANGNNQLDAGEDINGDGVLQTSVPNSAVIGLCQHYNNYVWIQHPNGEWSKYTHMATGSVTGAPGNLSVGDTVTAGQTLGIEADVGRAGGRHLHHEVAFPANPSDPTPFLTSTLPPGAASSTVTFPFVFANIPGGGNAPPAGGAPAGYYAGGFINGTNRVPRVCDIGPLTWGLYVDGFTSPGNNAFTANPCNHQPPTADAGGPYVVDEGSVVQLDGSNSSDPEGNPLTYQWLPATNLDDPTLAQPTYTGVDDGIFLLALVVYDQIEALPSGEFTGVTVNNVAPTVTAVGDTIDEGLTASVSATFEDPGTLDTHDATIDWGDGTAEPVTVLELATGVSHVYGDNGVFQVTVTVTDDDGGVGDDTVDVVVGNVDPTVSLDGSDAISFPGGDYVVVEAGGELMWSADGTDPGSDDLTFTWSTGDVNTDFNGLGPDPLPSPFGTFPFAASDQINADYPAAGVDPVVLTLSDDDGGMDDASVGVVVTGTADNTQGNGWWKHQFAGTGAPQVDAGTLAGYLDSVNAVSSVFSEAVTAATFDDVHDILSPFGGDLRARVTAALMVAWLEFASGAVAWDATVPLSGGSSIGFLDLMFSAEQVILDGAATKVELLRIEHDLGRVRHAS